jgi:hypothetical protein
MKYSQIKASPEEYTSGNIISRFIDGLGFRYYWATEELTEKDLDFKPSDSGQSTLETLQHIWWLTIMVHYTLKNTPIDRALTSKTSKYSFTQLRAETLLNIENASTVSKNKSEHDLSQLEIKIQNGDTIHTYPLWNMMNGPLSDALYHTGQIVSFRRSSGNPIPKGVNVFLGKKK